MSVTIDACADDRGSVMPLIIGYALLALCLILVCADATSLYLFHKRTDALADAAAVAAADAYVVVTTEGPAQMRLTDESVRHQADRMTALSGEDARVTAADTVDGRSARVTVSMTWHPAVIGLLVPDGVTVRSTAVSRSALH